MLENICWQKFPNFSSANISFEKNLLTDITKQQKSCFCNGEEELQLFVLHCSYGEFSVGLHEPVLIFQGLVGVTLQFTADLRKRTKTAFAAAVQDGGVEVHLNLGSR